MFERKQKKIATPKDFALRVLLNVIVGLTLIVISLLAGMIGYHIYEKMPWIDAYVNAAMILSGMGPVQELKTDAGKIFAGSYALFSGVIFLFFMAIIFAPIFHRFYHKFHFEEDKETEKEIR